jgi:hypothetical protein
MAGEVTMATEVPWTRPDFDRLLDEKLGTDWAARLEKKWGTEWGQPCAQELTGRLGDGWADSPQAATDTLVELLGKDIRPADTGFEQTADTVDPNSRANIDFNQYEWLKTFTEANSFESWLVRIGLSTEDAGSIVNADKQTAVDQNSAANIDLDRYEWLKTFTEANSFESWLVRIGLSADDASTIVNADQQSVEEGNQ